MRLNDEMSQDEIKERGEMVTKEHIYELKKSKGKKEKCKLKND